MAKINLSIPGELKEQMDQLPGRQWSQIATRAFENAVKMQILKGTDMSEAIERLRASKQEVAEEDRAEGTKFGKTWAMEEANGMEPRAVVALDKNAQTIDGLYHVLEEFGFDWEYVLSLFEREKGGRPISDEEGPGSSAAGAKLVKDEV